MNKIPNRVLLDNSVVRKAKGAHKDTRIDLLDWVNKQIALSNINIPSGGGGGSTEVINVLADPTVAGDGVTDDSAAISNIIASNPGKIIYFEKATYLARFSLATEVIIIGETGAEITWGASSLATISVFAANCTISNLRIINTHVTGKSIDFTLNSGKRTNIQNCYFKAHSNITTNITNNDIAEYRNCTFEIVDGGGSIGTQCWSQYAEYYDCKFIGDLGADVQDSKFYNCTFGDPSGDTEWGVHMPLGTQSNTGTATGFAGDAEFHNCNMFSGPAAVTKTYAFGCGNNAHPKLYGCTLVGNKYGFYARSSSTIEAYNCYFQARDTTGGAASVGFLKYATAPHGSIVAGGDSSIYGGNIVAGEHGLQVPEVNTIGSLTLIDVNMDWGQFLVTNSGGTPQPHNDGFQYVSEVTGFPQGLFESVAVTAGDQVIRPPYSPAGRYFLELVNNAAGTRNVRLSKTYDDPGDVYDHGSIMILRGTSDANLCNVKNGYWAAETTLTVNSSSDDNVLGNGDVAIYIYFTNTWIELTNFNLTQYMKVGTGGSIELQPGSSIKLDRTSTIPSPATDVLYLDDGTNHGLGGTPTLMFHNGVGWNALF